MKVIVAGFPKTGTKTMQAALRELGYVVYDFIENFQYLHDDWEKIILEGGKTEDFRRMYENVDAVTDLPSCMFWDEIHKAFPDAKIILTMREDEDSWAKSFEQQWYATATQPVVYLIFFSPTLKKLWRLGSLVMNAAMGTQGVASMFKQPSFNMTLARMAYRRHNSHVLQTAPRDKLLVYSVKEGWEPLCKFLQVEVSDKPFPHKNIRGSVIEESLAREPVLIRAQREICASVAVVTLLLAYGIYKLATSSPTTWLRDAFNWSIN